MADAHTTSPRDATAPPTGRPTRRRLLLAAVTAALSAVCLAGSAATAVIDTRGANTAMALPATVVAVTVGVVSLLLLVIAALNGRNQPIHAPTTSARRTVSAAVVVLTACLIIAVAVGVANAVFTDAGPQALTVIGNALLIALLVLLQVRWILRRLR